ncbi:MAG: hypothetical protein ACYC0H_23975, partial [Solirubrobacteraceae bacterium]
MARTLESTSEPTGDDKAGAVRRALAAARSRALEDPVGAVADAIRCHELGSSLRDPALCARALTLQAAAAIHRGDLGAALERTIEAERHRAGGDEARVELASVKARLSLFTGSYSEALDHARAAVALADASGDRALRIHARRTTCMVFGTLGARDLRERIDHLLELTIDAGDRWEEAISRNDLACFLCETGDIAAAEREIDRALALASELGDDGRFARAVVHSTRADVALAAGRPADALADADQSLALLADGEVPDPYVLAATIRAAVQARSALGRLDEARQLGEEALAHLGDRVPQTRSLILSTLATALREAGRVEDAYDALSRAAELERQAFQELSEL